MITDTEHGMQKASPYSSALLANACTQILITYRPHQGMAEILLDNALYVKMVLYTEFMECPFLSSFCRHH